MKKILLLTLIGSTSALCSSEERYKFKTLSEIGAPSIQAQPNQVAPSTERGSLTETGMDQQEIIGLITDYLQEKFQTEYDIQITSKLLLPSELTNQGYDLVLENVEINDSRSRLKAHLVFTDTAFKIPVIARLQELQEVPVLNRLLKAGEAITEQDITWQKLPAKNLRGKIATSLDELIGYQPRQQTLAAGEPIRKHELIKPQIIKRGALVMVSLENKGINISMQAKALDSGAVGDQIRVVNIDSNKVLKGTVDATGVVKIQSLTIYTAAGA